MNENGNKNIIITIKIIVLIIIQIITWTFEQWSWWNSKESNKWLIISKRVAISKERSYNILWIKHIIIIMEDKSFVFKTNK